MPYTKIEIQTFLDKINTIQNKVRDLEALMMKLRYGVSHDKSTAVKDDPTILEDYTAGQKTEIEKEIQTLKTEIITSINTLP